VLFANYLDNAISGTLNIGTGTTLSPQRPDASGHAGLADDQSGLLQTYDRLVSRRAADPEEALHIGPCRWASDHQRVGMSAITPAMRGSLLDSTLRCRDCTLS
jgi:hypothetical protein